MPHPTCPLDLDPMPWILHSKRYSLVLIYAFNGGTNGLELYPVLQSP